jgi:hypothetical protein
MDATDRHMGRIYDRIDADARVMLDCERCALLRRVGELEAERDAALAWAALWKRAAIVNRFDREHREWFVWHRALLSGLRTFGNVRYSPMIRRALGLCTASKEP